MELTSTTIEQPREIVTGPTLVERLENCTRQERKTIEAELFDRTNIRVEDLLQVLKRENRRKPLRFAVGMVVPLIVAVALGAVPVLLGYSDWETMLSFASWMAYITIPIALYFAPTRRQKRAARMVASCDDIRAVAPLLETLDKQDGSTKRAARTSLIRLLPRLNASDNALLTTFHVRIMRRQLTGPSRDLKFAILSCLEQVGDERFLPIVENLSTGKGAAKHDPGLQSTAKSILPALRERIHQNATRMTLLRPSGDHEVDPEALLRPASSQTTSDDRLLRPENAAIQ